MNVTVRTVPIGQIVIDEKAQHRELNESKLDALGQSLKADGMLQPVICVDLAGKLNLRDGFHRVAAAARAGMKSVPAVVIKGKGIENYGPQRLGLIANLMRVDETAAQKAAAVVAYMRAQGYKKYKQVAAALNFSEGYISQLMSVAHASPLAQRRIKEHEQETGKPVGVGTALDIVNQTDKGKPPRVKKVRGGASHPVETPPIQTPPVAHKTDVPAAPRHEQPKVTAPTVVGQSWTCPVCHGSIVGVQPTTYVFSRVIEHDGREYRVVLHRVKGDPYDTGVKTVIAAQDAVAKLFQSFSGTFGAVTVINEAAKPEAGVQPATLTGRLSSGEPNIQSVDKPKAKKEGAKGKKSSKK